MRVFYKVLEVYEQERMTGGFADSITLCLFDGGLNGERIEMTDRTFQNGITVIMILVVSFIFPPCLDCCLIIQLLDYSLLSFLL
jgi:hypothetical protein